MWTFTGFKEEEPQCVCAFNSTSTKEKVYFYNADNKILFIYGCVS